MSTSFSPVVQRQPDQAPTRPLLQALLTLALALLACSVVLLA